MPDTLNYKKVKKTIRIYAVVQVVLIGLLGYVAVVFQSKLHAVGRGANFVNAVIAAFVLQLIFFYPIFRFARSQASRDIALSAYNLSKEELKQFTKKARIGDVVKAGVICFYAIFIWRVPPDPVVLSVIFFSFILTILTYFQCYNFAAKKLMREGAALK